MSGGGRRIGEVILRLEGISLSFGGVKALSDISFDVREHEIRAIIGPNGAGKSSMLNVINGVYRPQQGTITFHGETRRDMVPHQAAMQGIATPSDIDLAMQKGVNYPRGPLAWGDAVGAARIGATMANLAAHYGEDRYRVSPRLARAAQTGGRLAG